MAFSHTIGNKRYTFDSLSALLAKATPLSSELRDWLVSSRRGPELPSGRFATELLPHRIAAQATQWGKT
jgi:hypothetical protein